MQNILSQHIISGGHCKNKNKYKALARDTGGTHEFVATKYCLMIQTGKWALNWCYLWVYWAFVKLAKWCPMKTKPQDVNISKKRCSISSRKWTTLTLKIAEHGARFVVQISQNGTLNAIIFLPKSRVRFHFRVQFCGKRNNWKSCC